MHKYSTQEPFLKHYLRTYSIQSKGKNLKTEFMKGNTRLNGHRKPVLAIREINTE